MKQKTEPTGQKAVKVFHLAMCPLFLGFIVMAGFDFLNGRKSLKWPKVPGVILSAEAKPGFTPHQLKVKYSYTTSNGSYVSNKLWVSHLTNYWPLLSYKESEKVVSLLLEKPMRQISVNPKNSNESVVFPGNSVSFRWWIVFVGVILMTLLPSLLFRQIRYNPIPALKKIYAQLNS